MDFFYGPYDTPEVLKFIVDGEGGDIARPNTEIDSKDVYELNENNQLVYTTRLNYQKALAEQMLTDVNQFFEGKKVCFIDDDGKQLSMLLFLMRTMSCISRTLNL